MIHMRIYLDTSGINAITEDKDRQQVLSQLALQHKTFVSLLNVAELTATQDEAKRKDLLRVAKSLARGCYPLARPQDLLWRSIEALEKRQPSMDFSIPEQDRGVFVVLQDPDVADESARHEALEFLQREERWYRSMHDGGRPHVQDEIRRLPRKEQQVVMSNRAAFLRHFATQPGFLQEVVADLLQPSPFGVRFRDKELEILQYLEPWRFYLGAIVTGIFDRSVRGNSFGHRVNAGSIDTQQVIYLAPVDVFVTRDEPQRRMLRLLERLGHARRAVWSYRQLRKHLGLVPDPNPTE